VNKVLALHESLELHELTTFKTVCLTKSNTMQGLVTDPYLRDILEQDAELSTRQVQELRDLLASNVM
jgi:similar to spore coat protein